jgi:hypothetical protein
MRKKKHWDTGISGARIWPKKNSIRVGYIFTSKFNREFEVTKVLGDGKYEIYSCGVYLQRAWKEIKTGQIKHPLDKVVYSKGFLGIGQYTYEEDQHRADCWRSMFKRCYSGDEHYHSYAGLEVCENWCNFQNFAKWYDENYIVGYDLDKDLKDFTEQLGYSPDTCMFIPHNLNKRLSHAYKTVPTKEGRKFRAKTSFRGKHFELGRYSEWCNALYFQVAAKFAMLEQEIRETLGESFVLKYWNSVRFSLHCRRAYEVAGK